MPELFKSDRQGFQSEFNVLTSCARMDRLLNILSSGSPTSQFTVGVPLHKLPRVNTL